jgi:hypothetical protein
VQRASDKHVYWRAEQRNARGQLEQVSFILNQHISNDFSDTIFEWIVCGPIGDVIIYAGDKIRSIPDKAKNFGNTIANIFNFSSSKEFFQSIDTDGAERYYQRFGIPTYDVDLELANYQNHIEKNICATNIIVGTVDAAIPKVQNDAANALFTLGGKILTEPELTKLDYCP